MPARYSLDRGTRVNITSGKYAGCKAIIEADTLRRLADIVDYKGALTRIESVWNPARLITEYKFYIEG